MLAGYEDLCESGPGEVISVNECVYKPDICGEGICEDTTNGYTCLCYPGYQVGEKTKTCQGKFYIYPGVHILHANELYS